MAKKLSQQEYDKRKRKFEQGLGWCTKCKSFKRLDKFVRDKSSIFGHSYWCKDCSSQYNKDNKSISQKRKERARALTSRYVELAGGSCQKCGYNRSQFALDFHHIDPDEKTYNPSEVITNGKHDVIVRELDKCVLLCANCHREFNAGVWAAEFAKRDGLGWTIKPKSIIETSHDEYETLPDRYRYSQISLVQGKWLVDIST